MNLRFELESIFVDPSDALAYPKITTLDALIFKQSKVVLVGDVSGSIRLFSANGTLLTAIPAGTEPVRVVKQLGSRLAYASGSQITVIDITNRAHHTLECPKTPAPIASLEFDVLRPSFFYVSTTMGDLLTYEMVGKGKKLALYTCMLTHRSVDASQVGSDLRSRVMTSRGYALVFSSGNGGKMRIFNTTNIHETGLRLLAEGTPFGGNNATMEKDRGIVLSGTPAYRGRGADDDETAVVAGFVGERELLLFQLLLPYTPPTHDISWIRTPIMIVGAITVAVIFFRMRSQNGIGGGGAGGLNGGLPEGFDLNDFKKFKPPMGKGGFGKFGGAGGASKMGGFKGRGR